MKQMLLTLTLLAIPTLAEAQTPTGYLLKVFVQGATSPLMTHTIPAANVQCGQAKVTIPAVNPNAALWDDPADKAKDCVYVDTGTGPLLALPFGTVTYEATLAVVNVAGTSADSARSNPFQQPGQVSAIATGLRVGRK